MNSKLLDTYASKRQLEKYVIPQILSNGFIAVDKTTLLILGLKIDILSLAQSVSDRHYQIWENFE